MESILKKCKPRELLLGITAFAWFYFLYLMCNWNLEWSDESYYLINIRNPDEYSGFNGITKYAYFFNFIYPLIHSLAWLRFLPIILITILILLIARNLSRRSDISIKSGHYFLLVVTSSLHLFTTFNWLATPNYNSLALTGILIVILAMASFTISSWKHILLVALGVAVTALGKPTSAIGILITIIFCYKYLLRIYTKELIKNCFAIPALGAAIYLLSIFIIGGYRNFLENLETSVGLYRLINSDNSWIATFKLIAPLSLLMNIVIISAGFLNRKKSNIELRNFLILILMSSFAFGIGSNNNYWKMAEYCLSLFVVLIIFQLRNLGNFRKQRLLISVMFFLLISATIVAGILSPYRSTGNFFNEQTNINIPGYGQIKINKNDYFQIHKIAITINSKTPSHTRILDLTGRLPVVALLTNRLTVGAPWTLGGYKTSTLYELRAMQYGNCSEKSKLILLRESNGFGLEADPLINQLGYRDFSDFSRIDDVLLEFKETPIKQSVEIYLSKKNMSCKLIYESRN